MKGGELWGCSTLSVDASDYSLGVLPLGCIWIDPMHTKSS